MILWTSPTLFDFEGVFVFGVGTTKSLCAERATLVTEAKFIKNRV
jgi:hypothetical protein